MNSDEARALRRRSTWIALALVVSTFVLDGLPIDDFFALNALAGAGLALARRSFFAGFAHGYDEWTDRPGEAP